MTPSPFTHQPRGKTVLAWLTMKAAAALVGRPVVCAKCRQPHLTPPALGRCLCGCYYFTVQPLEGAQPALDFHKATDGP